MDKSTNSASKWSKIKASLHEIIFEAETSGGKLFDILLIVSILFSVLAVMLDSVTSVHNQIGIHLFYIEWIFTVLFTIEYILRIISVKHSRGYIFSFFGIIDFLAIVPTYISFIFPGSQYFLILRILRVLRIFRILKLLPYLKEAQMLIKALSASRKKILVFLFTVIILVTIMGSIVYLIEGEKNGFTSIPRSIYWAIVTLTTVGYGDISPQTGLGQAIAAMIMILGYGIIAVPTGIVTVEMAKEGLKSSNTQSCPYCSAEGHDNDAAFCKYCGNKL